jgi:uncharacterized protein (DUF1330 family)
MPIIPFSEVLKTLDYEGPVDMVNELKFREFAQYPEGSNEPERSGLEAFAEYGKLLQPMLDLIGGTLPIWRGKVHYEITTDGRNTWDQIMVVRFPSKAALMALLANPDFSRIHQHRAAAVSGSRTYICTSA